MRPCSTRSARQALVLLRLHGLVLLVLSGLLGGCGSPHVLEGSTIPATDRDPLPYTPAPEAEGRTDRTVALTAAGGEDQARSMLHALLRAARDGDERQLTALLADEVLLSEPQSVMLARAAMLHRLLRGRALLQPDVEVEALVDLGSLQVTRAAQHWQNRPLPRSVRPTDVVVTVSLREPGRAPLHAMLGWRLRGQVVVRPGQDAQIVGL